MRFVPAAGGMKPTTPTIGTAVADNAGATVVFTPSTYIGKGTITYTATSSPSSITATAGVSPIIVTGLSNGTPYTFTVSGTTNYGVQSDASAASNSVTPTAPAPPPPPPPPPLPPPPTPPGPPPLPNCCPSGGSFFSGDGNCYYNCGTGSSSCACGPGQPSGYVAPNGTADCYYASPTC